MNLWLRLIWLFTMSRFRSSLQIPEAVSEIGFRVGLLDLDASLHMNNGRYLTIMDLGRLDLMLRSGLGRVAFAKKWTPIASAIMIRYRRELGFGQAFVLKSRILCWDAQFVVIEQVFLFNGGSRNGQVAAHGLFKGGLYDRKAKAFVPVLRLMDAIGVSAISPAPSDEVMAFLHGDQQMKAVAKGF